ncbi:4-hydroxy-tetrahydrodipicolinate reductase [Candidatus Methylacidiphilum fumarolicum]|uniref:4-hydroxy-tetrahydrodipicolinate reductase n=2 Tax=Candidatus Methylacidiphilum fumarolicum TaxID=591154 RepID=I0JZ22_METFB|nr:4-hydroxy-tetrahydrodipicolinate reductase [Candidatus Methylacidiphilum fumarolicum]MBW6414649.1 4-hydroxy-tetrahydrodipicolinate reductase [Candidatus Methylacidiphilum fumarolicum]TFE65687.1 4-hydroxy-tetrahydrodipicolinate reductase [Candidatus Methylacidiphilum fumarolicum]TFE74325.1 4-hydroxy-tetrahydrodipicolinate reductase [Candidatus Methylacidiphilum fumarolicum]TFE75824.1 4-hydroxy-tetrahydrodipicolinate reductase [Candidatus Methylacidiphilum fumarolicum]TFE75986.1 4-hydroxy-tet
MNRQGRITRILLTGAQGKMGQTVVQAAALDPEVKIVGLIDKEDRLEEAFKIAADCIIDFSVHHFSQELVEAALSHSLPLVIGTTGHTPEELERIKEASQKIPIVMSPNFSLGVNLLELMVHTATVVLGKSYDKAIIDIHHNTKLDAPSGTAKRLLEVLMAAEKIIEEASKDFSSQEKLPQVHSIRAGTVVGVHTVLYCGPGEVIELTHRAENRFPFAHGSLKAAKWIVGKPPAIYSMRDVLGLGQLL